MPVSTQDVERVAELANLQLSSSEKSSMVRDLNFVLDYFAELNQLDTTSVAPMTQVAATPTVGIQPLREDSVAPSLSRERVLACAPDTDGVYFKVPKVIER